MSKRSDSVSAESCVALGAPRPELEAYPNKDLNLGHLAISRALPVKDRRLVGPWCFLDRFGPLTFSEGKPMDVAPHPHIGLQTVTWLLDGEVLHDDSLGSQSILRPGAVNVMTSGAGISHAEQTPHQHSGRLNGVQLWTALPDLHRNMVPAFAHVDVPIVAAPGGRAHVFAGTLLGERSSAPYYSDLLGADLQLHPRGTLNVPIEPRFEHAILVLEGDCALDGEPLEPRILYYLGTKRSAAAFSSCDGGRALLIGGPPFPETILMWWNFVAVHLRRSHRRDRIGKPGSVLATSAPTMDHGSTRQACSDSRGPTRQVNEEVHTMMLDWHQYRQQLLKAIGDLGKRTPGTLRGYRELSQAGTQTARLDAKTRELIAIAVGVTRQCDGCITTHVAAAHQHGATAEEIAEALGVAIAVNAGAALVYSARAMDAVAALEAQP